MEEREGFGKQEKVYRIFEEIAGRYDNANIRISLGMQDAWKRMLIREILAMKALQPLLILWDMIQR